MRNFEKRDRSFRGFSKLNESLATWNLLNTLAIVQKKNLTPTPWGSSWTLRANFRENSAKIRKKMKTRENTQNRVQPPKTSPIEQITDRWEPKNSNLQRVTLQCLTSCYRWSNLLRDNVSNLALASAQNPPKIWKYAWKILIFLLWFLTFWPPFDIVRWYPIGAKN